MLERKKEMKRQERCTSIAYYAVQGGYWMSVCIANSYAAVFLQHRGYSNGALGLVLAIGNIAGFLLAPNLASLVDRSRRVTIYHCIWALLAAQGLILMGFTWIPGKSLALSLLYCLYMAAVVAVNPLNTELCFDMARWTRPVSYSPARGVGSLCFALMSLAMGRLTLRLGADVHPYAGLFCLLCQVAATGVITWAKSRVPQETMESGGEKQTQGLGLLAFIRANARFCVMMFSLSLLFFSYNIADFFLINILRSVGGDAGDLGNISAFKAMLEIPVMLFYTQLTSRFRCSTVIRFAALAFVAKALAMAMAGSVAMLYAANLFQALSFALIIPAMVQYVSLVIHPKDSAKGQAVANGMITLGAIFASSIGGQLYDALSIHATLIIGVAIAACGAVLCNLSIEKEQG